MVIAVTMSASGRANCADLRRRGSARPPRSPMIRPGSYPSPRGPTQPLTTAGTPSPSSWSRGLDEQRRRLGGSRAEAGRPVAELGPPVGVGAPGRGLELEPGAAVPGDGHVPLVVAPQQPLAVGIVQQREGREQRQVDAVVEDQVGLEATVGTISRSPLVCGRRAVICARRSSS